MANDQTKFIKNLIFQSSHRGMKELDILLGNFAQKKLPYLNPDQQKIYAQLLEFDNFILWEWISEQRMIPLRWKKIIFEIVKT